MTVPPLPNLIIRVCLPSTIFRILIDLEHTCQPFFAKVSIVSTTLYDPNRQQHCTISR
jgi:hypothetical protein